MAGKGAADIRSRIGNNLRESVGAGGGGAPRPALARREPPKREVGTKRAFDVFDIDLVQLEADPDQPRKEFDEDFLNRLAGSLKRIGQLQPIGARWSEAREKWQVVFGEQRFRAAVIAGLTSLKAVEVTTTDTSDLRSRQAIENMLRRDLKPIEEATHFREQMELNGWGTQQVADELNVSQAQVVQRLALLNLAEPLQTQVIQGTLSPTTAYEVSKIKDPEAQARIVEQAQAEELSRDEVREVVKEAKAEAKAAQPSQGKPPRKPRTIKAAKPPTQWRDKVAGFQVEVVRKKGWDWTGAVAALRSAADRIEAEHLQTSA